MHAVRNVHPTPAANTSLRALLNEHALRLRLVVPEEVLPPGALDAVLRGVHSSDLLDPTPFLSEDLVLLTTGTQFADLADDAYPAYVSRLRSRGVAGLGFGTEVVRDGVPQSLIDACESEQLALFEVPYETPFIAVARAHAQAQAAQDYARRTWALDTQRALSLAALRAHGVPSLLDELSTRLGRSVALFSASGEVSSLHPPESVSPALVEPLRTEVADILSRGSRTGAVVSFHGRTFSLQTVGRSGHLRGVLAVEGDRLDVEARGVVTMAVAMVGLAREQHLSSLRARASLRAGLAASVREGDLSTARRVAREMWGGLPVAPVRVALAHASTARRDDVLEWLEDQSEGAGHRLFFGRVDEGLLLIVPTGNHDVLLRACDRFGLTLGLSEPTAYDQLASATAQARFARDSGDAGLVEYATMSPDLWDVMLRGDARSVAHSQLRPLHEHDRVHHSSLVDTLRAWAQSDGALDRAATHLGVHRHTIRARLATVERILQVDLTAFETRARVWAMLHAEGSAAAD